MTVAGMSNQVIERADIEPEFWHNQAFNRNLIDAIPDCVKVLDLHGRLLHVNTTGQCALEIDDFEQLRGQLWGASWPADAQADVRQALATARGGDVASFQAYLPTLKGQPKWWEISVSPVRGDNGGQVSWLLAVSRDITQRLQMQALVQAGEAKYRCLFESMDQGYCVVELVFDSSGHAVDYRFIETNPAFEKQSGLTGATGQLMRTLVPDIETRWFDIYARVVKTGEAIRLVDEAKALNRWFDVFAFRLGAEGSHKVAILFDDISEKMLAVQKLREGEEKLRQIAAELSDAHRRKDEFLATLAHELRKPLAPIRNGLQVMKMAGVTPAAVEQARAMMERQLTQMVRLVDDLMDVSRISQGKLELRCEPVDLAKVLHTAVESSAALIEAKAQKFSLYLADTALTIQADTTRLAQVFLNLLNNAAKYSNPGGHIQLKAERQGNDAVVTVTDTGIGIAAEQLPHIFEMFTQVDKSLDMSQGGLGIGLTLVKQLVGMHQGSVQATSAGPGQGSKFSVRLPLVVASAHCQAPDVAAAPAAAAASLRILVVDDNRDGADSLSEMLGLMGNDTRTAYDGQQAVNMASVFRPDVVLLDIGLPKLNGYEACRLIRQQPWSSGVVLIAITGWGQVKDRERTREAGFDHHLIKPVDPQLLLTMLARLQPDGNTIS